MQSFLEAKREEIAALCRKYHVQRLAVFGSAVREDFDPERSDVDFLVEFDPVTSRPFEHREFEEELVRLLHRDVDLVIAHLVRNPFLRRRIREDRQLLYAV